MYLLSALTYNVVCQVSYIYIQPTQHFVNTWRVKHREFSMFQYLEREREKERERERERERQRERERERERASSKC